MASRISRERIHFGFDAITSVRHRLFSRILIMVVIFFRAVFLDSLESRMYRMPIKQTAQQPGERWSSMPSDAVLLHSDNFKRVRCSHLTYMHYVYFTRVSRVREKE